jgi:hypothetical protein
MKVEEENSVRRDERTDFAAASEISSSAILQA